MLCDLLWEAQVGYGGPMLCDLLWPVHVSECWCVNVFLCCQCYVISGYVHLCCYGDALISRWGHPIALSTFIVSSCNIMYFVATFDA